MPASHAPNDHAIRHQPCAEVVIECRPCLLADQRRIGILTRTHRIVNEKQIRTESSGRAVNPGSEERAAVGHHPLIDGLHVRAKLRIERKTGFETRSRTRRLVRVASAAL
jgi:hypothetical protein